MEYRKLEGSNIALLVLAVLLYGTLVLPERRSGATSSPRHRIVRGSHARHAHMRGAHYGEINQIPRRLFLRLDALGARRAGGIHLDPIGARTVGSATETGPSSPGHGHRRYSPIGYCRVTINGLAFTDLRSDSLHKNI